MPIEASFLARCNISTKKSTLGRISPTPFGQFFSSINDFHRRFSFSIGYLEIYNDQLCDLLRTLNSPSDLEKHPPLSIGEDPNVVYVKGLTYRLANSEEEGLNLLFEGETNRSIGQHVLNKQSSRSHCIFTVIIECRSLLSSDDKYTVSKLNLVDLAGSERLAKTNVRRSFFVQTKCLLLSLLVRRHNET